MAQLDTEVLNAEECLNDQANETQAHARKCRERGEK